MDQKSNNNFFIYDIDNSNKNIDNELNIYNNSNNDTIDSIDNQKSQVASNISFNKESINVNSSNLFNNLNSNNNKYLSNFHNKTIKKISLEHDFDKIMRLYEKLSNKFKKKLYLINCLKLENNNLEVLNQKLTKSNEELESKFTDLQKNNEHLLEKYISKFDRYEDILRQNSRLQFENNSLVKQNNDLAHQKFNLESKLIEIINKYEYCSNLIKEMKQDRDKHKEDKQKYKDMIFEVTQFKDKLAREEQTLKEKITEKTKEVEELTEKNHEIILELEQAKKTIENLSRDPDELILEIDELNERLAELKNNYDESRIKLDETSNLLLVRTAALNEANQTVSSLTREVNAFKTNLDSAEEWIFPEKLLDVVKVAQRYYGTKLSFHKNVETSIGNFVAADSDNAKKYRFIQEAIRMIKSLAIEMYKLKFIDNNLSEKGFTELTGIEFGMTERKQTKKQFEKSRKGSHKGQTLKFYPHIKSYVQGTEFRIYFQFLDDERKILIFHIGDHLPTMGTRNM
jgi:chromosome segregation ATPase